MNISEVRNQIPYLPTHEHVVAVGIFGIMRIRHSVERTHGQGELVQNVEVSLVFVLKREKLVTK